MKALSEEQELIRKFENGEYMAYAESVGAAGRCKIKSARPQLPILAKGQRTTFKYKSQLLAMTVGITSAILSSCSLLHTNPPPHQVINKNGMNSRVVTRNLAAPKVMPTPVYRGVINKAPIPTEVAALKSGKASRLIENVSQTFYIEFPNESWKLNKSNLNALLDAVVTIDEGQRILIVGNSHGASRVGTGRLAHKRADAVYQYLIRNGVKANRIHRLASWDNIAVDHAPSRGVQVMFVTNDDPSALLVRLVKNKETQNREL